MLERFIQYAATFEDAYEGRDFAILEPYFTEDVQYEIRGYDHEPLRHDGRDAVLGYLDWITERFDKRFARRQVLRVEGPSASENRVEVHGVAVYTLDTSERCHLSMSEVAYFRGDRIERLVDTLSPGAVHEMRLIVEKYPERFSAKVLLTSA